VNLQFFQAEKNQKKTKLLNVKIEYEVLILAYKGYKRFPYMKVSKRNRDV